MINGKFVSRSKRQNQLRTKNFKRSINYSRARWSTQQNQKFGYKICDCDGQFNVALFKFISIKSPYQKKVDNKSAFSQKFDWQSKVSFLRTRIHSKNGVLFRISISVFYYFNYSYRCLPCLVIILRFLLPINVDCFRFCRRILIKKSINLK
jgi:hypothetical protein